MLSELARIKKSASRSISAENKDGSRGGGARATQGTGENAARDLGLGWKVSPSIMVPAHESVTLAQIEGPGAIKHIWMTCFPDNWRSLIVEMYWEGESVAAVQVPFGDFFCNGWCERSNVNSLPIVVNPAGGMNSYWEMPFKTSAKIVVKNLGEEEFPLYYQIDYALEDVASDCAYFCAFWTRSNPVPQREVHTLLPRITGSGQYVGTYIAYQSNSKGWWGEGEMKFYLDGDREYPTICGTGTEDYFGGAWNFEHPAGQYGSYSTPFLGLSQVIKPDGLYASQQRFGMYRWHVLDPIRFSQDLEVTIQSLGWRSGGRYLSQQDDISSTAFFYYSQPSVPDLVPDLSPDNLEVI